MTLQVENLQVKFGSNEILKDINLSFSAQKLHAIIGPSGCGKTTLLKSLNRTLEMEKGYIIRGKVKLCGENIYEQRDAAMIRRKIGLVFQTPVALPLSIKENVLFAVRYLGERNKIKLQEICESCLQQAGLWEEVKDKLNCPANELSGGQIQRLSIARALAVSPEVLLLDEPCSNLDPASTQVIEGLLRKLATQLTIILVTHNLFQAKRIADITTLLMNGQVIETGETTAFFNKPEQAATRDFISGLSW